MKAQTEIISIVIIAGIVIALVGAAYIWAVPLIEKRTTISDYTLIEKFILDLNDKIVEVANTGSGEATMQIPSGMLTVKGYDYSGPENNSIILDFHVNQPLIIDQGRIPIKTSSLDYIGEYGNAEPRVIFLSGSSSSGENHLNFSMRYRELRSSAPRGYVIALCPPTGGQCDSSMSGSREIRVYYERSRVEPREPLDGGDLTIIYLGVEVS